MKLGIFSDIHGNIDAFEKVWQDLNKEKCDQYCFLGDICGYYYFQNEVIELLRMIPGIICLLGNHDEMFLRLRQDENFERSYTQKYGKAGSLLKTTIKPENLRFLEQLSPRFEMNQEKMLLCHASPWDELNEYIYPTTSIERFKQLPYRYVLLGHTHHPMDRMVGGVRIINPGSCGQPRDFNMPSYALLDADKGLLEFKRVDYDRTRLINAVASHGETSKYLIEVLHRQRKEGSDVG